jgi:hypothetical protein
VRNWFPDTNKFMLPKPPAWWLKRLHDQDAELVVFPSRLRPAYILARRRSSSLAMPKSVALANDLDRMTHAGDGDVMAAHGLVHVENILGGFGNWTDNIFHELRRRDIWAAGGADKFNNLIVESEQAARDKQRKDMLDDIDHRSGDAFRSYQARTGQRNKHANDRGGRSPVARIVSGEKTSSSRTAGSERITLGT